MRVRNCGTVSNQETVPDSSETSILDDLQLFKLACEVLTELLLLASWPGRVLPMDGGVVVASSRCGCCLTASQLRSASESSVLVRTYASH